MPSLSDITAAFGIRPATNVAAATPTGSTRLSDSFRSAFQSSMSTVFERGYNGAFEDRSLALEEQAALQRLRIAQQQAAAPTSGTVSTPDGASGADAAPQAHAVTPVVSGGGPAIPSVAVAEKRNLYAVRVRQSEARLSNISSSLKRDFPLAAKLQSASAGSWDPATFTPRTREEAEAFAHRLVIDATEAAARLEILKTQLDSARFELTQGAGADVQRLVVELEARYDRQKAYVDKLAAIVDRQSGGQLTDAGTDALAGTTMRDDNDLPVDEIAAALRAEGFTEAQIKRVVGASEAAVEQERQPGGSARLKSMASEMTRTLLAQFNERIQKNSEETRRQEAERREERRIEDKRYERKRVAEKAADQVRSRRQEQQAMSMQARVQRAAQQRAEFELWLEATASR